MYSVVHTGAQTTEYTEENGEDTERRDLIYSGAEFELSHYPSNI